MSTETSTPPVEGSRVARGAARKRRRVVAAVAAFAVVGGGVWLLLPDDDLTVPPVTASSGASAPGPGLQPTTFAISVPAPCSSCSWRSVSTAYVGPSRSTSIRLTLNRGFEAVAITVMR